MGTLREYYESTCRPQLQDTFAYTNIMEIPRIEKVSSEHGPGRSGAES
jgi:ribosomal protein L5